MPISKDELIEQLSKDCEEMAKVPPHTSLYMNHAGKCVELYVDGSGDYSEWIKGEGADIALMRERDTDRVVGVRLPMYHPTLVVDPTPPAAALADAARELVDAMGRQTGGGFCALVCMRLGKLKAALVAYDGKGE